MEYFNLLPEEITLDIISRIPAEDVLECKLVSTNWRSLVRHPSFRKMHFHHLNHPAADSGKLGFIAMTYMTMVKGHFQYFEYNENHETIHVAKIRTVKVKRPFGWKTNFFGSCNGLICLYQSKLSLPGKTYICNPITREYIMLPEIKTLDRMMHHGVTGFGYVSSTSEYKVVTIIFEYDSKFVEVFIYTLGSGNGWRNIGKFNLGIEGLCEGGIFVKGVLYWLGFESDTIVSFDLAEEKFFEHLSPPASPPEYVLDENSKLWVLDGCLSFAVNGLVNESEYCDVWLLRNKDDNHCMKHQEGNQSLGWSKPFRVFDRKLLAVTKSYTVLTYEGNRISIHDLEASTSKTVVALEESFSQVFRHENTLVSLTELGEEDTKRMETVEAEETESHDQPFNQL